MIQSLAKSSLGLIAALALAASAQATVITFTGGTVTLNDATTVSTNNASSFNNVSKYEELGFRVQFIFAGAPEANASFIGNYYGAGNDVIHGHWNTGDFGNLTRILFTKIDGSSFDLNYFVLTSNTDTGGGPASGNEKAFIHASSDGVTDDYSQQLPVEDWGFPATQIFLGSQFDSIKAFWFDVNDAVDCFGMDSFFIDEPAPVEVPEPASFGLAGLALAGAFAVRRRKPAR